MDAGVPINRAYRRMFRREMRRQLGIQQTGMNRITIDEFLHNRVRFRMDREAFLAMDNQARLAVIRELRARARAAVPRTQEYLERLRRRRRLLSDAIAMSERAQAFAEEMTAWARNMYIQEDAHEQLAEVDRRIAIATRRLHELIPRAAEALRLAIDDQGNIVEVPRREDLRPIRVRGRYPRYWELRVICRGGAERVFRDRIRSPLNALIAGAPANARLPNLPEWTQWARRVGDIAVLHNPDQVAGGFDRFPTREELAMPAGPVANTPAWRAFFRRLLPYVGLKVVNEQIGAQWSRQMEGVATRVAARVPAVATFINSMNVRLQMTPPRGD